MSNIIPFNGYTRNDIDPDDIDPDGVLEGAKGQLSAVLVIGRCEDGDNYAAASTTDKGKLLLMIEEFKLRLLDGDFDD